MYGLVCPPVKICSENPDKLTCILILLGMNWQQTKKVNGFRYVWYFILLSQWRKENSNKAYANCTGFIIMVFIHFFILFFTSQSTKFQLCRHIKLKLRYADPVRGWQRVLTPSLENRKPLGLFSNTDPDSLENQKLPNQHSILGNYRPASVLLLGWWWSAFSGISIPHSIHLKKSVSELSWTSSDKISGSAHD